MYALTQVATGLIIAHVLWAIFYLTGSALFGTRYSPDSPGRAMLALCVATASGMAIYVLEGIGFGLAGLTTPLGWYIATLVNGTLIVIICRGDSRAHWWRTRADIVLRAFRGPAFLPYFAMLVFSAHAALPDFTDDGVRYHLAYAYEWFRAGRIFADHHFRFPLYTFNTEVLYAWMFVLRIGRYIPFVSWMAGTVAVLTSYGLMAVIDERKQQARSPWAQNAANVVYAVLPLSIIMAAIFLRWTDAAMPDALSGMLFATATAAIVLVMYAAPPSLLFGSALSVAFVAGMKPTYLLLLPLFIGLTILAKSAMNVSMRLVFVSLTLMCACSLPWYVRNVIVDGDPVPPLLHIIMGREDPDVSKKDLDGMSRDLRRRPITLALAESYPLRLFRKTDTNEFGEYGVSLVVLGLYGVVLFAPVLAFKAKRNRDEIALLVLLSSSIGGCLYLFATSLLARYFMLEYPLLAASTGSLILYATSSIRNGLIAAPGLAAVLVLPSRSAIQYMQEYSSLSYAGLSTVMPSDRVALERQLNGFSEAEPLLSLRPWVRLPQQNVLLVNSDIQYYIELYGGEPFGDWIGMTRYAELQESVDEQQLRSYLDENQIVAIVLGLRGGALAVPELESFREQATRGGFVQLASSDKYYDVFVRRGALIEKDSK